MMTVGQLLELLHREDPDTPIALRIGYTDYELSDLLHYNDGTLRLH